VKDSHGYDEQAPVFGEGKYFRHADTAAKRVRNEFESEDKATRLNDFTPKRTAGLVPDHHSLPRKGEEIVLTHLPSVPPIKANEVAGRIRKALDIQGPIPPAMRSALDAQLRDQDLITPERFEEILQWAREEWAENVSGNDTNSFTNVAQEETCNLDHPLPSKTLPPLSVVRGS
jgi:hypothetical protein